jgi:transposase
MWITAAAITISDDEQRILQRLVKSPTTPQGIAQRCRIVLLAQEGIANHAIAKQLSISRPTVLLWRDRFIEKGSVGLLTIEEGRGRKKEIQKEKIEAIIHDTLHTIPPDATHWSTRTLAKKHNVSHDFVKKIWHANGLKPHLIKTFKLSNDKHFIEKLKDVVGLYLNPPEHALVFSVDEKTQIQALDRTQLPLPLRIGHKQTVTHDYKRHGTTTLFAALNILKGEVIGECVTKHRHQEFIAFLNKIDQAVEKDLEIHCIVDNYSTHKHIEVKEWLIKHQRFHLHFIPTSSSWLNLVERWFREITTKRIRRGTFRSVPELIQAIEDFITENNKHPKPFVWTKTADQIIAKVSRGKAILKTLH